MSTPELVEAYQRLWQARVEARAANKGGDPTKLTELDQYLRLLDEQIDEMWFDLMDWH